MAFNGQSVTAVVLGAGSGSRMEAGINKMFLEINGVPLLYRTLYLFEQNELIDSIILISQMWDRPKIDLLLARFGKVGKLQAIVNGGTERAESVRQGLQAVSAISSRGIVMIHDGARPFVSKTLIARLLENVPDQGIVIPVLKVFETVRNLDVEGQTHVLDRDRLFFTQTPQIFEISMIQPCFLTPKSKIQNWTDEASYFEVTGKPVKLVEGEKCNIKLTTPEDLLWAEFILQRNKQFWISGQEAHQVFPSVYD